MGNPGVYRDFLQLAETIFRVQFRVRSGSSYDNQITFADDVLSFFQSIQVRLSNTIVEDKGGIPDIAATERLFYSEQSRNTWLRARLAYDDTVRSPGSVYTYYPFNRLMQAGAQPQGQIAIIDNTLVVPIVPTPADTFNNIIAGNGIKWFMSRNANYVEGVFRLSDVCPLFQSYRSVTRGVTLEVILNKSPTYRCLQYRTDENFTTLGGKLEWAIPNMSSPSDDADQRAEGITMWCPVYRPNPVMLNILEEKLAKGIQTDIMFERPNVYVSPPLTGLSNTWRAVVTPFKITKAIVFFRQYDSTNPQFKTFQTLHSMHSSGRMAQVSMDLNGQRIPRVNEIPSYFCSSYGQGVPGLANEPISNTADEWRTANSQMMYVEYLKMCHALEASYPSSNYTGAAGISYEDFTYLYPTYCFQISDQYGESENNDRQTSSLILNWKSSGAGADGQVWPNGTKNLEAVCVVYSLHQCNIITGSAQESSVRCL